MEAEFECLQNYKDTLMEVSMILEMADKAIELNDKYVALNKSAILLLTSKFENFIESVVDEFVYLVNQLQLKNSDVPEWMRIGFSIEAVDELKKVISKEDNSKKIKIFKDIAKVWNDDQVVEMKVDNKFNYGKHGANELIKLFNNIGIKDIFKTIKIKSSEENIFDDAIEHDFKGTFNNITNQRNFITHQDKSPNITHKEIQQHKEYLEQFADKLCEYLISEINKLKGQIDVVEERIAATISY